MEHGFKSSGVMNSFGVTSLPLTYIIDGTIGHQIREPINENLLNKLVSNSQKFMV
jgi:hypothetical protein